MKKLLCGLVFFLVMAGFCLAMMTIPSDAGGFSSPYFKEVRQSQRIEFEHQNLLDYAKPWQVEYLRKIDIESLKTLKEVNKLFSDLRKSSSDDDLVTAFVGLINEEMEMISEKELALNSKSPYWDFQDVLDYWVVFREHPMSPFCELKDYLSLK